MRVYHVTIPLSILFAGTGFYLAWANRPALLPGPVHPVTVEMIARSERMKLKTASDFNLAGNDGKWHTLAEFAGKPTFLYFIKKGCPCSIEAEPLLQSLAKHHGDKINVVAVIDGSVKDAQAWAKDNAAKHVILCDPKSETMKAYDSPNSVYTSIIATDGKIEKQWPGWSRRILLEENAMLAKLSGQPERDFDTEYAPLKDSSGCSFFETPIKP